MGLVAALAVSVVPAGAQNAITRAKDLYQSADYDEALSVLDTLKSDPASGALQEVAAYRVFCLLALGRGEEAHQSIGAILRQDPGYQPSASEASPRIRAVFEDDRRRLLPQILQERYELAKASFLRKEFQSASDQFKTLMSLIDDPALVGEESRPDFRMVISSFSDLAQAAVVSQAPARAEDRPLNPVVQAAAPETPRIYDADDSDVVPPVALSRKALTWTPPGGVRTEFTGVLELIVDEKGNVTSASLKKRVYPGFDLKVIQAAREWKYQPAVRQGVPVSYRILAEVKLTP